MFKVCKGQCDQCLFSDNRIVSLKRAQQIIKKCMKEDSFFRCHKEVKGEKICCRGFWNNFKDRFNLGRIVQRLGGPEFVDPKTGKP
jgi:hypothetical protein